MTTPASVPRIETARLVLRPFAAGDVDAVFAYASDAEFRRYLPLPEPYTRADAEAFVGAVLARDAALHPEWAIERDGRVIGAINARYQPQHHRAAIGYGIGRAWWVLGLTTEAARAVVGWAFATWDIVRVYATADTRNIGSRRVMEHLGMRHEGTLRAHRTQLGEQADEVWYGLLREEWQRTTPP